MGISQLPPVLQRLAGEAAGVTVTGSARQQALSSKAALRQGLACAGMQKPRLLVIRWDDSAAQLTSPGSLRTQDETPGHQLELCPGLAPFLSLSRSPHMRVGFFLKDALSKSQAPELFSQGLLT